MFLSPAACLLLRPLCTPRPSVRPPSSLPLHNLQPGGLLVMRFSPLDPPCFFSSRRNLEVLPTRRKGRLSLFFSAFSLSRAITSLPFLCGDRRPRTAQSKNSLKFNSWLRELSSSSRCPGPASISFFRTGFHHFEGTSFVATLPGHS